MRKFWLFAAFIPSLISCVAPDDDVEVDEVDQESYVNRATVWPNPGSIPVCWSTAGWATEKEWVRTQIVATWDAVSLVNLTGWGTCTSDTTKGIRIAIADVRVNSQFGTNAAKMSGPSMYLNFTYRNWNTTCQNNREFCIRAEATHEFGHALGFMHEQDRPDTPGWCDDQTGSPPGEIVGSWDASSVMNYCNGNWNNGGRLSAGDVSAVRYVYGNSGAVYPLAPFSRDYALAGAGLIRGESLVSRNGRFRATMQHDGNLVVYMGSTALWHTKTYGTAAYSVIVQGDGNFVMYDLNGSPRWWTGTQGTGSNVQLTMQDDGNLVLYRRSDWRAIWASNTGGH